MRMSPRLTSFGVVALAFWCSLGSVARPQRSSQPPAPSVDLPATVDDLASRLIVPIPDEPEDIAIEIGLRDLRVQRLIRQGVFTEVYVPALEAKDLALALEAHRDDLPEEWREPVRLAITTIVRTAWLLDKYGDLGNRRKVDRAYGLYRSAVASVRAAYGIR